MVAKLLNSNDVKDLLTKEKVVLLDIFATWCGPCKMLKPIFDQVSDELKNISVVKINGEENENYLEVNNVTSYPTVILYKDGEEVERFVGFKDKDFIINFVKKNL